MRESFDTWNRRSTFRLHEYDRTTSLRLTIPVSEESNGWYRGFLHVFVFIRYFFLCSECCINTSAAVKYANYDLGIENDQSKV